MSKTPTKNDLLYNPRLTVSGVPDIVMRWQKESARARGALPGYLDVPYGSSGANRMDIFRASPAAGACRGTVMFIHGGYWRAFGKQDFSFIATELTRAGVTVAVPDYSLCPQVTVRDIVMQMVQAGAWLYRNASNFGAPAGRVHIVGHSAGGHLAAMLLACLWPRYSADLPVRTILGALSISGIYDLSAIVGAPSINDEVRLTAQSCVEVSPVLLPPPSGAILHTALGSQEIGGFAMQDKLIRKRWGRVVRDLITCPGDNHFTVLERLLEPSSRLFETTLAMLDD